MAQNGWGNLLKSIKLNLGKTKEIAETDGAIATNPQISLRERGSQITVIQKPDSVLKTLLMIAEVEKSLK